MTFSVKLQNATCAISIQWQADVGAVNVVMLFPSLFRYDLRFMLLKHLSFFCGFMIWCHSKRLCAISGPGVKFCRWQYALRMAKIKMKFYSFFWAIPRLLNFICRRFGTLCSIFVGAYEVGTDSVPKRWHIKFRHRRITQKKAYNIQNTAKVWNQE